MIDNLSKTIELKKPLRARGALLLQDPPLGPESQYHASARGTVFRALVCIWSYQAVVVSGHPVNCMFGPQSVPRVFLTIATQVGASTTGTAYWPKFLSKGGEEVDLGMTLFVLV